MSARAPRPPRLARTLLTRALPSDVRESILGDLEEVFTQTCETLGANRARLWYWREAISFSVRFLRERTRGGAPAAAPGQAAATAIHQPRGEGGITWLDLKLGLRMLVKYPVLTLVGGLAITVAASIGVGGAEFMNDLFSPRIPLEDGDRIVRMGYDGVPETLFDYVHWRDELRSVTDVSAAASRELGVVTAQGVTGSLRTAQVTASVFTLARLSPQLGRTLTEEDERAGAPPVVVIGHEAWQQLFGGGVALGQTVQLGGVATTVVGVMPEGFGFPINQGAWVPLRFDEVTLAPGSGQAVMVAGRLAEGVSEEEATAEIRAIEARMAADYPERYGNTQAQVLGYGDMLGGADTAMQFAVYGVRLLCIFLLVVACANVATLVFARAVNREGEIALRTALGATRKRIVVQLFAEALVLVSGATALALVITSAALRWGGRLFWQVQEQAQPPFWWDDGLSLPTILFAVVLALVGAVMVGVVPALKATSGRLQPRLSQLTAGGGAGIRFGGGWTAVVIFQVALSVAFLPIAVQQGLVVVDNPLETSDFPADRYLTAELARDLTEPMAALSPAEREEALEVTRQLFEEVKQQVAAQSGVQAVAFADWLPGMNHPVEEIEVRGDGAAAPIGNSSRLLSVDPDYLNMMGATVVSGRGLVPADFAAGSRSVLVNQSFVDNVMAGANVVGAQLRFSGRSGEDANAWYDVVGVVTNPEIDEFGPGAHRSIYAPLRGALTSRVFVALRPEAEPKTAQLYSTVGAVNASLRLESLATVEEAWGPAHRGEKMFGWIFALVAGVTLVLSVAGIYAIMSFTVSQRTREIAVRTAVGASPSRIVLSVFSRAFLQLALGVAVGCVVAVPVIRGTVAEGPRTVVIVGSLLLASGLASCLLPIRRALRIQPSQAMKSG